MVPIDAALVDRLLYEAESDALDFKRDQYPFVNATDAQKAELLKDILAMAKVRRFTRTASMVLKRKSAIQRLP